MAFIVIYDACVLFPQYQRDLLIRIATTNLVRARWSADILDETFRSIKRTKPDLDELKLARTRELLCIAVEDCLVENYASLIPTLDLPDQDDRHVLAAAIKTGAQEIVTNNIKDFPAAKLKPWGIQAVTADQFILHQIDLKPGVVVRIVAEMLSVYKQPPMSLADLLEALRRAGLPRTATALANAMGD